jgi:hypothetical protein
VATAKRLLADGVPPELDSAIGQERRSVAALFETAERVEGLKAYRERRAPRFTGH